MRWRVERCGDPGHYLPGWIAYDNYTGTGATFDSQPEAFDFAFDRASERLRDAQRAIMKLASRTIGG